jgi:hypothetical protein
METPYRHYSAQCGRVLPRAALPPSGHTIRAPPASAIPRAWPAWENLRQHAPRCPQGLTAAGGPVAAPSPITLPVIRRSKPSAPAWPVFRTFAGAAGVELLADVDRDLLRAFQSALARGGRGRKPLSAPTRHRRLVALGSFLRFCAREGWTVGDLGVAIDLPNLPKRLPKPLQADELERVTTPHRGHGRRTAAARCRRRRVPAIHRLPDLRGVPRRHAPGDQAPHSPLPPHGGHDRPKEEVGDPRLTAEFLGHHGPGSVAGYTEISRRGRGRTAGAGVMSDRPHQTDSGGSLDTDG